jgi:hypothetical protein
MMADCGGLVPQVATGLVYRARTVMTEGSAAGRAHTFTVLGAHHRHRVILMIYNNKLFDHKIYSKHTHLPFSRGCIPAEHAISLAHN